MKLEDVIRDMILRYPSIFPNRAKALNQIYCVLGAGLEWKNGEISGDFENTETLEEKRKKSITYSIRVATEYAPEKEKAKRKREAIKKEKEMYAYVDKNIDKLCKNNNIRFIPPWDKWMKEHPTYKRNRRNKSFFYPLSTIGFRLLPPPDAKPDWRDGAIEVCKLILTIKPTTEERKENHKFAKMVLEKLGIS